MFKLKDILKSQKGMSMLETLVGTAFIGLIILFGMKQSQVMSQSNLEARIDRDIVEWHAELIDLLAKVETCNANFDGKTIGEPVVSIVDENDFPLYKNYVSEEGNLILKNEVKINSMSTQLENDQIILNIDIEKVREKIRTKTLTLKIHVLADVNAGVISNCFSFDQSASNTIEYLIAQNICEQAYGEGTDNFDADTRTCNFSGLLGGTTCPEGQVITSFTLDDQGEHIANCSPPYTPSTCPNSWVQSVDSQGNFSCMDFSTLVDTTGVDFNSGHSCQLSIVSNMIRLTCGP